MNKYLRPRVKHQVPGSERGFTLIELLIFMGVFSILMITLTELLVSIFDVQLESQSTAFVSQDGRYILNKLTFDIRNASSSSILNPSVGASSSSLIVRQGATTYTYSMSNGDLILSANPSGLINNLNSTNTKIENLNFYRLSDNSGQYNTVSVTFTLNSKTIKRSGTSSANFNLTVGTR